MTSHQRRLLGLGLVATAGAGLLALTSVLHAGFAYGQAPDADSPAPMPPITPDLNYADVMGGSGTPIPSIGYLDSVARGYLTPNFSDITSANNNLAGVFTPEGLYPLTGIKSLPLDTSVPEGLSILNTTINEQIPQLSVGNELVVLGYSQSAIIASLEMENLANPAITPNPPSPDQLAFVLLGDPMNPNGGLLERFDGLLLPSLGLDFYGATPPDTSYSTNIYTLEYDGYADFCQYPLDLPCDLNAFAGIEFVHPDYPSIDPSTLPPGEVIELDGSGTDATNYYLILQDNLPLLDPLRSIPFVGNPLADLIQPDLTYIVNLGYGDPDFGYSTTPANIATPFGFLPALSDFAKLPGLLVDGTQQGFTQFVNDITGGFSALGSTLPSLLDFASGPAAALSTASPADVLGSLNDIVNALTSASAAAYATLLPTADIANALLTSMPLYDANLFVDNLLAGDPIDAIGLPIAADTALLTLAAGFEYDVLAALIP